MMLWALLVLSALVLAGALWAGPLDVGWEALFAAVLGRDTSEAAQMALALRGPRALGAFAAGGLLALAGALMQVLLRNPLADPYVLGISGGAAVGALFAMLLGQGLFGVNAAAFGGALGVMLLVLGLSHGVGSWTPTRLLLTGVMLSSGCSAVVALILSITPGHRLPGMLFWLMGDASGVAAPGLTLGVLAAGLMAALLLARSLNVLGRGALAAQALGVPVKRVQLVIYLLASLLTAVAVTTVGAVGFVGLIAPHAMRLLMGGDHRLLLPACVLAGGSLVSLADTLSRTLMSPLQLPVGVVMALIGVPTFLLLLTRAEVRA
ncbi:MAG: hypothetical protein RIR70_164 [Pseudomonadota bacterium]|jgi:iron complex transport system permease protein